MANICEPSSWIPARRSLIAGISLGIWEIFTAYFEYLPGEPANSVISLLVGHETKVGEVAVLLASSRDFTSSISVITSR